jgi:anhydro-N-acetylmuramic acid kinase
MFSIGLMSGTSMDGIDAALLDTDGENTIIEHTQYSMSYVPEMKILLKSAEYAVKLAKGDLDQACIDFESALKHYLNDELQYKERPLLEAIQTIKHYIKSRLDLPSSSFDSITLKHVIELSTRLHHEAIIQLLAETQYSPQDIKCIGYHGQTVFHQPHLKKTIQLGDGQMLAELTGIHVINDFRRQDVALGGQGAPFAPLYHQALARRDHLIPMAVINCGGIANISLILGNNLDDVIGFDTGPGNCLIDAYVKKYTHGKESMDQDGQYARRGTAHPDILKKMLTESMKVNNTPYLHTPPPKSLDVRDIAFIPEIFTLSLHDACATLAALTAECIVQSITHLSLPIAQIPRLFVLAGGGAYNPMIIQELTKRLQKTFDLNIQIKSAHDIGWRNQAIEAQLMAYFAVRSLKNLPLSTPKTTGVPFPISGGTLHRPTKDATHI